MIEWTQPLFLWSLLALFPLGLGLNYLFRIRHKKSVQDWPGDPHAKSRLRHHRLIGLWSICGFAAILVALAGPRSGKDLIEKEVEERQLIFLLDISRSMLAEDISPNRITIAQRIAEEVRNRVKQDRIGLIAFAGEPYMVLPLTRDRKSFTTFIRNTEPNTADVQGTDIASALGLAYRTLGDVDPSSVHCIILSDGENHEKRAIDMAATMAEEGIRIHTVGLGSVSGGKIPIRSRGRTRYVTDRNGEKVISRLQPKLLQTLAREGSGTYLQYESLYSTADQLSAEILSSKGKARGFVQYSSYTYHYIYAGIFALFSLIATLWILWDYRYD